MNYSAMIHDISDNDDSHGFQDVLSTANYIHLRLYTFKVPAHRLREKESIFLSFIVSLKLNPLRGSKENKALEHIEHLDRSF